MAINIIDVTVVWKEYIAMIVEYAQGTTQGRPNLDSIMREVVEENLSRVRAKLQQLSPPGVVTKKKLKHKASSALLWREFDKRLRKRAEQRKPEYTPWRLPMEATKYAFRRYDVDAFIQADGKYDHTRNADIHHIWPETLKGPSKGWNLVPLPPFTHHDILHPILDRIVRESKEGQRFRLL